MLYQTHNDFVILQISFRDLTNSIVLMSLCRFLISQNHYDFYIAKSIELYHVVSFSDTI